MEEDNDLIDVRRVLAGDLGGFEGTLKAWLHRGRKLLRGKLGGLASAPPAALEAHA